MISCPRPTLRVLLREIGSMLDIRLVPYNVAWRVFSGFSGYDSASEGLLEGIIEKNYETDVVVPCS